MSEIQPQEIVDEVLRTISARRTPRASTYRLQFNSRFTFRDAARIVPYLRDLGVSHVYASPYFTAQPGSPHGYDVCRHDQLNPEVGSSEDYTAFVAALREHDLGQVLDMVPNHMAASTHNPWWVDVLENGPSSPYARYFDIDWHPVKDELEGKVLLPILGDQYGQALEAGHLQLDRSEGSLVLRYYETSLPIGPKTAIPLLEHRIEELKNALGETSDALLEFQSIITALRNLPPASATSPEQTAERQREKEVIKRRLRRLESEEPRVADFLHRNIQEFNGRPGEPESFNALDQLLSAQAYRLCHWRAASDEVNYRRFFDVNGLAALCMESAEVFERTHRLAMQLLARGDLDGLRIDHIDGLLDPTKYLWRLQWAYLAELAWHAYAQRTGQSVNLDDLPPLAIARREEVTSSISDEPFPSAAHQAPDTATSGAIGAVVVEQEAVAAEATNPQQASTWTGLRPAVLRALCEHFNMPYPDQDLLSLAGPLDEEGMRSVTRDDQLLQPPISSAELPLYVVVEKILGPDEPLPENWPVAGTSGYDFLQLLNGLLVDPQGFREVTRAYERFIGEKMQFSEVVYRCKLLILRFSMSSELQMLAQQANRISEHHRRSRDFTLNMLRHALREMLASFPVYRTYASASGVSERDRRFVNMAVARAKRRSPATETAIFDFLREILLLEHPPALADQARQSRELFAGRFQQVTSPVMAKGTEDTAFYTYCPLISVNEVGSHPDVAPVSVADFHRENLQRLAKYPTTMLGTSTHDTKRSEDMRARINVLAEIPNQWRKACNHWLRLNRRLHREVDGLPAPSRSDEYLFYQTLVGFWPIEEPGPEEHASLVARLQAYMEKATHEAKQRTSWVNPNSAYDEAVREFVGKTLERSKDNRFLNAFTEFNDALLNWGLFTALSQVVLKIMSPGVPDIYQSQELWDFSLVDPDNRRSVDYPLRTKLLSEIGNLARSASASQPALDTRNPRDPRLKLLVTARLLQLRRRHAELFKEGHYVPLQVTGPAAGHVVAFTWQREPSGGTPERVLVVVPRLLGQLAWTGEQPRNVWTPEVWQDTRVEYEVPQGQGLRHLFSDFTLPAGSGVSVATLFEKFPVAVLTDV